jgi:hypothetical protein
MSASTSTLPQFAPNGGREKDPAQLVRALESQVAFIDGDPTRQEDLELYYYRFVSLFYFSLPSGLGIKLNALVYSQGLLRYSASRQLTSYITLSKINQSRNQSNISKITTSSSIQCADIHAQRPFTQHSVGTSFSRETRRNL